MTKRQAVLGAILAATVGAPRAAGAAPGLILLESSAESRSAELSPYARKLVRSLGAQVLAGEPLRRQIEEKISLPAGPAVLPRNVRTLVEEGSRQFIDGQFDSAIKILEDARALLVVRVGLVSSDQGLRDSLYKALLFLGHAYLRTHKDELALERVSEVIRSFPERDLSLARFGPELVTFYKKVRRQLDAQQRGTLAVSSRPPGCMVFVNERFIGLTPAKAVDLYPGRYRVYVQRPQSTGRVHFATIRGGDHQLTVDAQLDQVLRTTELVGLEFADTAARERGEVPFANAVGNLLGASGVVLVGVQTHEGHGSLVGTLVSTSTGLVVRSGLLSLDPAAPSEEAIAKLGQFLVAGKRDSAVVVKAESAAQPTGAAGAGSGRSSTERAGGAGEANGGRTEEGGRGGGVARVFKWVTLGVGLAVVGAGVPLLVLDGKKTCDAPEGVLCPERYKTLGGGVGLVATGGALLVTSLVLFIVDARRLSASELAASVAPVFGSGFAGVEAIGRF
jgi:hypothetical protein